MARRSEQGNVLGFVLVGAVLATLLVGGVWFARNQLTNNSNGDMASNAEAPSTPEASSSDKKQPNQSEKAGSSNGDKLKDALSTQQAAEEKKAQEQRAAQEASSATRATAPASTGETLPANSPAVSSTLPATGPGDVVIPIVGATSLVGVVLAYRQSRRLV